MRLNYVTFPCYIFARTNQSAESFHGEIQFLRKIETEWIWFLSANLRRLTRSFCKNFFLHWQKTILHSPSIPVFNAFFKFKRSKDFFDAQNGRIRGSSATHNCNHNDLSMKYYYVPRCIRIQFQIKDTRKNKCHHSHG